MPGRLVWIALLLAAALVGGCGGGDDGDSGDSGDNGAEKSDVKQGGKLTYLWAGDVDYLDPGQTYYQAGYAGLWQTASMLLPSGSSTYAP